MSRNEETEKAFRRALQLRITGDDMRIMTTKSLVT